MKKLYLLLILSISALLLFNSCQKDNVTERNPQLDEDLKTALSNASAGVGTEHFLLPESDNFSAIPQDPNNPITTEKVELGKLLYHETGLAVNPMQELSKETYSCASCHFASAGFQAGRVQGIAEGGVGFGKNGEGRVKGSLYTGELLDVQPIRSPSAMNGAYQSVMLWNGQFGATGLNEGTESHWTEGTPIETNHLGFEGLEIQAIAGLGVHRMKIDSSLIHQTVYREMFDNAFPDIPEEERYTKKYAGLAIAAFERTLLANQSPFQKWLRGDELALTDLEKQGAIVFFDKANCSNCHNGPGLNNMEFHALGMGDLFECPEETFQTTTDDTANLGRGGFTNNPDDMYKFKVPQLYNLKDSPFFGHGSSFRSVREVVNYKNNAAAQNTDVPSTQLAEDFIPLGLTNEEINALVAFIESGLHDPNLKRYEPESLPSGNCFPFNDPLAADELGCN